MSQGSLSVTFPALLGGQAVPARRAHLFAWLLLGWWCALFTALQGLAVSRGASPWLPDVGVIFLAAFVPRTSAARARGIAFVLAGARIALSVEPPVAILAGYFGITAFHRAIGSILNMDGTFARFALTTLLAWSLFAWLMWVHLVRHPELASSEGFLWPSLWPSALATGLSAALFAPVVARLPGLRSLWGGGGE